MIEICERPISLSILIPKFSDLYFGKSDSRNEANSNEHDFIRSFVDLGGVVDKIRNGQKFLVLGPKGTGKSALAWYLKGTSSAGGHLAFVQDASTLPLAEVPRLQTGQEPGPERTVVAWKFILLCNYIELLLSDQGCSLQRNPEVMRVARLLRRYGFMGDAVGRALLTASTTTISLPLPKLGTLYKRESKDSLNIFNLIPYMEEWIVGATSESRHILMLDGLDSIFLNDRQYNESLASLVQAAYSLNQKLQASKTTGSIVLLLRNDVFSRIALSLPDSQKMRDDLAIELDWRVLSGAAGTNAPLLRLVNTKASQVGGFGNLQVLDYFESKIQVGLSGSSSRSMPTLQYLLNLTRHTPRDLLRLFDEIRKVEASGMYPPSGARLSRKVVREGVLRYSAHYFVGAVRNEFAGFDGGEDAAAASITALQNLGKQDFNRDEFAAKLAEVQFETEVGADRLLQLLFFAGAIGNLVRRKDTDRYLQFYHRRDEAEIYLKGQFTLHNALVHAWGLPHGG